MVDTLLKASGSEGIFIKRLDNEETMELIWLHSDCTLDEALTLTQKDQKLALWFKDSATASAFAKTHQVLSHAGRFQGYHRQVACMDYMSCCILEDGKVSMFCLWMVGMLFFMPILWVILLLYSSLCKDKRTLFSSRHSILWQKLLRRNVQHKSVLNRRHLKFLAQRQPLQKRQAQQTDFLKQVMATGQADVVMV